MVATLLSTAGNVSAGVVNVAGAVLGVGGVLLAALWLHYVYN